MDSQYPSGWVRVVSFASRFRSDLAAVVVYAVAVGALTLAPPVAAQVLINTIAFGTLVQPLVVLAALLAVALGLSVVLQALQTWVVELLSRKLFTAVSGESAHALAFLAAEPGDQGTARARVNRFFEVVSMEKSLSALLVDGTAAVLQIFVGLVLLAFYHPLLLAFDMLLILGLSLIFWPLGRRALRTAIAESSAKYRVAGLLEQLSEAHESVSTGAARQHACAHVQRELEGWLKARAEHFRIVFRQMIGFWGLQVAASVSLLTAGGWLVIRGQLALGQLVAAELVMASMALSLARLAKQLPKVYDFATSLVKLPQLTELPRDREVKEGDLPPEQQGSIRLSRQVQPGGAPSGVLLLELARRARQVICASPAERKPVFDLLTARERDERHVVQWAGVNVRELDGGELRDRVRLARTPEILPGSVYDNVRAGRQEVSLEQARRAIQAVGLGPFVDSLPEGGHTLLDHDVELHAEQRILITLARGIAGAPEAILIDGLLDQLPESRRRRVVDALSELENGASLLVGTEEEGVVRCLFDKVPSTVRLEVAAQREGAG